MNDHTVIQSSAGLTGETGQHPLPLGMRIEDFEIRGIIGLGGFGIVYEAWDRMLERQVALKEYLPGTLALRMPNGEVQVRHTRHRDTFDAGLRSFINEARLLAQFDHPALVKVYRFWEMSGTAYMVMPLYRGTTLKQHIEEQQAPLPESTLLLWLSALTEALEVMHSQQCYHRDISPENIIIQAHNGLPILLDFGAARRAIGHVSQPFTVILKASYAPIEQYAEVPSLTQGPWTDVYALAAVAHFLMTGKTPPMSVGRMVNDSYTPLVTRESLPFGVALKNAVDRGLAVYPQDRTQCMRQFREACLNQQLDVLDLFDTPAPLKSEPTGHGGNVDAARDRTRKRLWPWGIGLLLLLVLIVPGFQPNTTRPEQPPAEAGEASGVSAGNVLPTEALGALEPQGELQADTAFQNVLNRADAALQIQPDKTVLRIGEDLLQFKVHSPFSGHLAVYVRASDNTLVQLLPNARVPAIGIEANQWMTLPPANEPIQAAGPAGSNRFLVVVTEQPRDYTHLKLQDHYGFGLIEHEAPGLDGTSPCAPSGCQDRMAAGWFSVAEVD